MSDIFELFMTLRIVRLIGQLWSFIPIPSKLCVRRGILINQSLSESINIICLRIAYQVKNCTRSFFIPVPRPCEEIEVIRIITDKLIHLSEWQIIPENCWELDVPVESRERGYVNEAFVSFSPEISLQQISMTRILLTDTYWPEREELTERPVFRCFWANNQTKRKKTKGFQRETTQTPQINEGMKYPTLNQSNFVIRKEKPKKT